MRTDNEFSLCRSRLTATLPVQVLTARVGFNNPRVFRIVSKTLVRMTTLICGSAPT